MNAIPAQAILARRVIATLYALILCATLGYCISQQSFSALLLMGVATVGAWLLVDSPLVGRPLYPPKWLLNIVVLLGACKLFMDVSNDELANQSLIVELSRFIMVLLACKLFEHKTRRDISQSIILSLLVIVAGAMFSFSGLSFTVVFVVYLAALCYFASVLQIQGEVQGLGAQSIVQTPLPQNGRLKLLMKDVGLAAKFGIVLAAPVALGVFLFMPRTRSPSLMPVWPAPTGAQTGYTETIRFGESGTLTPSESVVMNVRISRNGQVLGSGYDEPYFRGQVLDEYSPDRHFWGRRGRNEPSRDGIDITLKPGNGPALLWSEPVSMPPSMPPETLIPGASPSTTTPTAPAVARQPVLLSPDDQRQDYQLLMQNVGSIFTIPTPLAVAGNPGETGTYKLFPLDMVLRNRPPSLPLYYTVYSRPGYMPYDAVAQPFVVPGVLRTARQGNNGLIPEVLVSTEIMDLAHNLVGDYLNASGRVARPEDVSLVVGNFERYLRANYPYSMELTRVDRTIDPTTDFLINRKGKGGHCEYFASSMVMLCRAVGINSRVVAGFRGGDYSPMLQAYVVREKHAHAWAEVYLPGTGPVSGWTTSDPTPGQIGLNSRPSAIQLWARDVVQFVESTWTTLVVTFDDDSRRSLIASLKERAASIGDYLATLAGAVRLGIWEGAAGEWTRWVMIGSAIGILVAVGYLVKSWAMRRSQQQRWAGAGGRGGRHAAGSKSPFLNELLRVLERATVPREAFQTPLEYAEQSIRRLGLGGVAEDARFLVSAAYAAQFGGVSEGVVKEEIDQALARVKVAARGKS